MAIPELPTRGTKVGFWLGEKVDRSPESLKRTPNDSTHPCSFERSVKLFEIYRDCVKHEDTLANYRTTWLLAMQPFLATAALAAHVHPPAGAKFLPSIMLVRFDGGPMLDHGQLALALRFLGYSPVRRWAGQRRINAWLLPGRPPSPRGRPHKGEQRGAPDT